MANFYASTTRGDSKRLRSLRLIDNIMSSLQDDDFEFLINLEAYDPIFLRQALLSKGVFETESLYEVALVEFKKFVALYYFFNEPVAMTSPEVDALWHQFILFTRQYFEFCNHFLGSYLHHEPSPRNGSVNKGSAKRFCELYSQLFGTISRIWRSADECSSCETVDGDDDDDDDAVECSAWIVGRSASRG
jgi:hypothetical protein